MLVLLTAGRSNEAVNAAAPTQSGRNNPVEAMAAQWEAGFSRENHVPASALEKSLYLYFQRLLQACGLAAGSEPGDTSRILGQARTALRGETQRLVQEFVDAGYARADAEAYFEHLMVRLQIDLVKYFGSRSAPVLKPAVPEESQVADDFYAKAEGLLRARDLVGAIKALEDALRFAPYNVRLTLDLALRQLAGGNLAEARANFDLARARYPKVVNIYIGLGMARERAGDFLGAMVEYTTAIYLQPGASRAYAKRGMARMAIDDYEGAIDDFGLQIASGYPVGLASVYVWRGKVRYSLGNVDNARADLEAAVRVDPSSAFAYVELSLFHAREGEHQASLAALNQAIELQPNNPEAYGFRLWDHYYLGDTEAALQDADRMIALARNVAFYHMTRAALLEVIDRAEPAEAEYREAVTLAKQSRENGTWYYANFLLDMFLRRSGRKEPDYLNDVLDWPDGWPKRIALYLSGRITAESLLNAAAQSPTRLERLDHECEANFYIGMARWSAGEHLAALPYLQACARPRNSGNLEFCLARKLLRQVETPAPRLPSQPEIPAKPAPGTP